MYFICKLNIYLVGKPVVLVAKNLFESLINIYTEFQLYSLLLIYLISSRLRKISSGFLQFNRLSNVFSKCFSTEFLLTPKNNKKQLNFFLLSLINLAG